jgi:Transporter associated domain
MNGDTIASSTGVQNQYPCAIGCARGGRTASTSARVYGCAGSVRTVRALPSSTILPAFITATRIAAAPRRDSRPDGSYIVSGNLPVDDVAETVLFTAPIDRGYKAMAGIVIDQLRHIPCEGETVSLPYPQDRSCQC